MDGVALLMCVCVCVLLVPGGAAVHLWRWAAETPDPQPLLGNRQQTH